MNKKLTVVEGAMELMAILGGAEMKTPVAAKVEKKVVAAPVVKAGPETVYEHGSVIAKNGIATFTGTKKRGGARGAKDDAGKSILKEVYMPLLTGHAVYGAKAFEHSAEGLVIRMDESDYTVKVSKAKEKKYDVSAADFKAEKDFSVRGKAKNSAPGIAKAILEALESPDTGIPMVLISAKGSGIILQMAQGEYTVKISKKRDRVGFEAEKGSAY